VSKYKELTSVAPNMISREGALKAIKQEIEDFGDITLGTDVEVLWMNKYEILDGTNNYKFYHADNVFPKNGLYGTDGRTLQGEWRITPAQDVRVLMKSMTEMITMCKTYVALKQRRSQGMFPIYPYGMSVYSIIEDKKLQIPESIGLHIHFGTYFTSNSKLQFTVAALDALLAPVIRMFEPPLGAHIRTDCGYYGDLSDYKEKPYGMEYRTLPSCIDNKEVFAGAFALAKAIVFETRGCAQGNITEADLHNFIIPKDKQFDKGFLKILAKKAQIYIKSKCKFYYVYKKEIDTLFELALAKDAESFYNTQEHIFSTWDITCDFSDEKLIEALSNDMILLPSAVAITGYDLEEDEEELGLCKSSQRCDMETYTLGTKPW
jgi:hypothetical protein